MIIVTGATGFIGSNLVADLNAAGRSDIIIVDDLGTQSKWKNIAKRRFQDIVLPSELDGLLANLAGGDAVYHMGANSSTTATNGDAILLSNFRASKSLWEWCARTRTPFIYASSAATYGDGSNGFEDAEELDALDALRPLNLYGWSKHAFDKWAVAQSRLGGAPPQWCGLKFFNVYGPNENHKGDMRSLICKTTAVVSGGDTVRLFKSYRSDFADGQQLRDFVYVKDCTQVMLWLAGRPQVTGIFNLGTGRARSFVDLVRAIGAALNRSVDIEFVDMPEAIRANYQYFTEARMSKLAHAGYEHPFFTLEAGVADYVQRYLAQPDIYR
ncbi:MAG: hldD [Gammaproteobacteria bacterium]|nr:hldD [Gammaproteobacteria bacterium]